jgi:hypothetical protein
MYQICFLSFYRMSRVSVHAVSLILEHSKAERVGAEFSVLQELLDPVIKSSAICYKVLLEALGLDGGLEVGVE